jgi:hypothetical protein
MLVAVFLAVEKPFYYSYLCFVLGFACPYYRGRAGGKSAGALGLRCERREGLFAGAVNFVGSVSSYRKIRYLSVFYKNKAARPTRVPCLGL